jgi:predicted thioredoxin/glutaredoxin
MKRTTIYFEEEIHKALKLKAAEVSAPVSDLVNEAVRAVLREDAEDLAAFNEREHEPVLDFETFVTALKQDGKL